MGNLKATGPPSGGVLGSSENEGMTPTRTGLGTDHEESRIFCKLRRDGSHILELHYNLTMDAERDTGVNKTSGNTYHIYSHGQASTIAIGDGSNVYAHPPVARASGPADQDHIYDFPPKVENDPKVMEHRPARQGVGFEEKYQGREQREREKRHGCLDANVVPRVPTDSQQQRRQGLNPGTGKGTIVDTGAAGFLENVEKSIKEFDDTAGPLWEQKEQFILQVVLPSLEESWRKLDSSRKAVYETLAKISCSRGSPKVVSYTLQQLHSLMLFDTLESGKDNLLGVEKIIRLSICSHDAVFKEEGYLERVRRLSVYRRILALLIFQQIKGWFFAVDIEKTKLVELQGCLAKYPNQKEDCFQFSIVFIQEAISHLLKSTKKSKNSNVRAFLNECQANIETQGDDSEELSFLRKLKNPEWVKKMKRNNNKNKWLAVHCVILYLYEKAHSSELHESQLQIDRRAVDLLQRVIKAYKDGGGGNDWKFCLLPATVVSDIVMKNVTRDSSSDDSPYSITEEENGSVTERIMSGDKLHQQKLLILNHPNLCINLWIETSPVRVMKLISVATRLGNLKEYVLNGRCEETNIVTFLSQVASALHYLHKNHIVHAELRAEHVNVVELEKGFLQVQIVRFGRSKSLVMRPGKDTSESVVADMSPDSTRWSAPEVILQGHYSHASDVWSFGVVAWELYEALTNGVRSQERTLPYFNITNDEILTNIQNNKFLRKPNSCPDWVYVMMQQCWRYNPKHRPPFTALFECLTSSKPKQSLLMNEIEREPCQQREDIEKMCLDDFLTEHEYQQVSTPRSCEIRSFKTDVYETVPVSKASGRPPLPTSESTEGYETLTRKGRSNQCPLPTPETTRDYENLPTYGKSKRPTLPIPRNTGLAANDTHAKGHARLLETTI